MELKDRKRIVNELCDGLKHSLMKSVKRFPEGWDGRHIRALAGYIEVNELKHPTIKKALSEMKRSMDWYGLHRS